MAEADDFILKELAVVKSKYDSIEGAELITCVTAMVQIKIVYVFDNNLLYFACPYCSKSQLRIHNPGFRKPFTTSCPLIISGKQSTNN